MNRKQFSTLVKRKREKLGMSQEDFAHILGVSWLTVWRWENDRAMPRHDAVEYWIKKVEEVL